MRHYDYLKELEALGLGGSLWDFAGRIMDGKIRGHVHDVLMGLTLKGSFLLWHCTFTLCF